jgi:carbon starvation protein
MVMRLDRAAYGQIFTAEGPVAVFAQGVGAFLQVIGISAEHGTTFAALAISAFVLTTLDTATRLARYAFQELFIIEGVAVPPFLARDRYVATFVTVACAAGLSFSGHWRALWPIFGSANQMLAALALLAVSLWLAKEGKRTGFLRVPMVMMFVVTLAAFGVLAWNDVTMGTSVLAVIAAVLGALTVVLFVNAMRVLRVQQPEEQR